MYTEVVTGHCPVKDEDVSVEVKHTDFNVVGPSFTQHGLKINRCDAAIELSCPYVRGNKCPIVSANP